MKKRRLRLFFVFLLLAGLVYFAVWYVTFRPPLHPFQMRTFVSALKTPLQTMVPAPRGSSPAAPDQPYPISTHSIAPTLPPYPAPTKPANSRTPTLTLTVTPTARIDAKGWLIYENPTAKYSVHYPPGVKIVADDDQYVYFWFQSLHGSGHFGMEIEARANPENRSALDVARQIYEGASQKNAPTDLGAFFQAKPVTIGGRPATKMKIPAIVSDYTLFVPNSAYLVIINLEHDAVIIEAPEDVLKQVDEILATMTFAP